MLFAAGVLAAGCSSGGAGDTPATTTTTIDPMTTLLDRVAQSVTIYVDRAVLQRPDLTARRTRDDLVACAVASSKDIARSIYLNRLTQSPTTVAGSVQTGFSELLIGEATAAAQSQIEPVLARCARGG